MARLQMRRAAIIIFLGVMFLPLTYPVVKTNGGSFVVLREGTPVVVKTADTLDTSILNEGETVHLFVAEKVMHEGATLIEKGASVEATVVMGTMNGQEAKLLNILGVQAVDKEQVKLRATPEPPNDTSGDDGKTSQLQALFLERNRWLPAGTTYIVYLSETYLIEE